MTNATLVKRLTDVLGAASMCQLGKDIGFHGSMVWHMRRGKQVTMKTLRRIHERTRIPIGILAEWWLEDQPDYRPPKPFERVHGLTPEIEARMFGAAQQPERETP
ncbi:hypothetical protein E7V67_011360 [[Empedobacter] haloabium]|uniref:Helix-turn-helix transcriptional regulator n=1 Tax=[Empedobacter] haloabium TaxID=592317 RepID=A0ABZ1UST8_9BURK